MIRLALESDIESVYSLICDMEQKLLDKDKFMKIYNEYLQCENRFILIFEQEKEVLGVLNFRMEYQLHHCAKIAEVMELSVKQGSRSKGIGKALLDGACEAAKKHGCIQIEVCCNQLRTKAHNFYEREGMNKYHYKFSKNLNGEVITGNKLGL